MAVAKLVLKVLLSLAFFAVSTLADSDEDIPCERDPLLTCQCLMSCDVFSSKFKPGSWPCGDTEESALAAVDKAVGTHNATEKCESIKCVMGCSKQMHCIDEEIIGRCMNVEQDLPGCDMKCIELTKSGSTRSVGSLMAGLVATVLGVTLGQ
mmetsp:Transcript_34376/g.51855  ORF Transcript_34376/g.51855 Transcript_34376/m.51855 type:complete len:152 (-) Transcript_34376:26-481(-)